MNLNVNLYKKNKLLLNMINQVAEVKLSPK